jgi:hypothetical protein
MNEVTKNATLVRGVPASGQLSFRAMRNGSEIGTHDLRFSRNGEAMTVAIEIDYVVKIAFITVFRYKLRGREVWNGSALMSAQAETDVNGKGAWMLAERKGDSLVVQGSKSGSYKAPAGVLVASHWNRAQLKGPMINPQDGTLVDLQVAPLGPTRVTDSSGVAKVAEGFSLTGKAGFDLWYDAEDIWSGLQARAMDGSTIRYVRTR